VRLLGPLVSDLAEWRLACRRPGSDVLLFTARDGDPWSRDDWANWRNRVFGPAAAAVGLEKARPYDLRHSFCSLLIHEGATVVEVARQLGRSTLTKQTRVSKPLQTEDGRYWARTSDLLLVRQALSQLS
jgi:site-specific recombinase XerD